MKKRIEKLRSAMERQGIGCCIIHKPVNIYYFSNVFPREHAFLLIPLKKEPKLVTAPSDFKYAEESSIVDVVRGRMDIASAAKEIARSLGCFAGVFLGIGKKSIGIEGDFLGISLLEELEVKKYVNISPIITKLRSIKDKEEIKNIEKSVKISEKTMGEVFEEIKVGKSEKEISGLFDYVAKRNGAGETKARPASGENTSKPFQWLSEKIIEKGPLMVDYGTTWKKYWTDITRTFYLGKPAEDFENVYEAVLDAQKEGMKLARVGEEIASVDVAVREVLKEHGYEKYIVYASGHGIGLETHELPIIKPMQTPESPTPMPLAGDEVEELYKLARAEKEVFEENMVITLEPGLYLEKFGVRIEDMILIKKRAKLLSSFPKSLESVMIL